MASLKAHTKLQSDIISTEGKRDHSQNIPNMVDLTIAHLKENSTFISKVKAMDLFVEL